MVLYNGKNNWTACKTFKEILNGYELFEENVLDFNYILLDINRYKKEDLYELSNLISAIFLLDQEIDKKELVKRLRSIAYILKQVSPEQFSVFKQWLRKIVKPRLDKKQQQRIDEVLDESNQQEVDSMVHNLEKTLDNIKKEGLEEGLQQGMEKGIQKGVQQVAYKMLKKGLKVKEVVELTDLEEKEVLKLKERIDRQKH